MNKKLTIGMACYDDYDGVYFSIKAMQLYHQEVLKDIQFLVIDNNPKGRHGKAVKNFLSIEAKGSTYIPCTEKKSSFVKYKVFELAETPYVVCIDSHVLFEKGSLRKLIRYYKNHPNTNNLLQGPQVYNNMARTHWNNVWKNHMLGEWRTDPRGGNPHNPPFEIQLQGMGLCSSRKEAFPKINPLFDGFGGEEGYIQGKFKERGNKTLCLPFLRWHHRFDNEKPSGITYPLSYKSRARNRWLED